MGQEAKFERILEIHCSGARSYCLSRDVRKRLKLAREGGEESWQSERKETDSR